MVTFSTPSPFIRHDNHTPTGSFVARTLSPNGADYILIRNTDGTSSAQISFDGTNGFTIRAGEAVAFELNNLRTYYTKAVSGSPALEVLTGSDN